MLDFEHLLNTNSGLNYPWKHFGSGLLLTLMVTGLG